MKMAQMGIFSIVLIGFLACHSYVLWRLWFLVPSSAPALRIVAVVLGVCLSLFFIAGMALRSAPVPVWLVGAMYRIGTAWTIVFFYLVMIFLVGDLLRLVRILPSAVMLGNWWTLGALSVVMVALFVAANITYHNKRRVEMTVQANVSQPVTIVAASDLHLGFGIGPGELSRWVDMINAERPDVVLFAGDVIDTGTRPLWQLDYASQMQRIDAPQGVFAVLGNHEYISGSSESVQFLRHAGVRVLRDSIAVLPDSLYIIGRDDATNRARKPLAEITQNVPDGTSTILLDHQPYNLNEASAAGVTLQISGHTHRGQVWPANWITDRLFEHSHGELHKGRTRYYISSGLGIWGGKFRLGSRSEYLVVKVVPYS